MINYLKNLLKKNKKEENVPYSVENRINDMFGELSEDIFSVKTGTDIVAFCDILGEEISDFRENLFQKSGFIFPVVRVIDCDDLQENEFQIFIRDKLIFNGFCHLNQDDAVAEIIDAIKDVYNKNIEKIFCNEILEKYIDTVQKQNGWLVWNLTNAMPIWGIKLILVNLLQNGKSIKNISYVFEKICKYATKNRDICIKADPYVVAEKMCSDIS